MSIDDLANNPLVQMTTLIIAVVLLVWASRHRERRVRNERLRRTSTSASNLSVTTALTPSNWLALVNDRPDEIAHLAIFGASGSGKTVLSQGILAARGGQIVVIDPKPPRPGQIKWGGLPYIRIDRDGTYRTIDAALRALRREVNVRLAALDAGVESPLLTVVLDEYKALVRECPGSAPDLLVRVSDIGRELGMRLVILSQSRGVAALGLKGLGDTRENFVTITIDRQHRATLEWDEVNYWLDTAPVVAQAAASIPSARWWPLPVGRTDRSGAARIGGILDLADRSDFSGLPQSDAETGSIDAEPTTAAETGVGVDAEIIRTLYAAGWSKNRICGKLRGAKDRKLQIIDAALGVAILKVRAQDERA